jgi:hypothetical protein
MWLQPLEERLLLFSELFYQAELDARGLDLTLRIDPSADGDRLILLGTATGAIAATARLSEIDGPLRIIGSDVDDIFRVDGEASAIHARLPHGILLDGNGGQDTLVGGPGNTVWHVTGQDSGLLGGEGVIEFRSVENLTGASGNEDLFIVSFAGRLSGVLDGGPGGFDTMELEGGAYTSVQFQATGPHSGSVTMDDIVVEYDGLEPITLGGTAANVVIDLSPIADIATLTDNGLADGQTTIQSNNGTFETATFANPTNSLTINLAAGNDVLTILPLDPAFNAALTINGDAGADAIIVPPSATVAVGTGNINFNAEGILIGSPGSPTATVTTQGDIVFAAANSLGTMATPDTGDTPVVLATVNVNNATINGANITFSANTTLFSNVTNNVGGTPELAVLAALDVAEVAVDGNSSIAATGFFMATAASSLTTTVTANAIVSAMNEVGRAAPVINNTARSHLSGSSTVNALGAVSIQATTNTNVTTIAQDGMGTGATGTTTATPVVTTITDAFIDGSASVTNSASIGVNATANSQLATTAISTSAGAANNPDTLADLALVTSAGPQTDAAAVAATTLIATTRAFTTTSGVLNSGGSVSLLATSNHHIDTTANATPTVSASTNNGFAVGTNLTLITDESFIGGSPTINAPTINIQTGGGNNLGVLTRSGAAGLNMVNQGVNAGSFALNTNLPRVSLPPAPPLPLPQQGNLSQAYIAAGANLTLPSGNTDINIGSNYTAVTDLSAEPDGVIAGSLGVGRSVATNLSITTSRAAIEAGAQITGADDVSVTADGNQTTLVTAYSGALAGVNANSQTLAGSLSNNSSVALIDAGATMNLSGTLTVDADHHGTNIIRARSDAAASLAAMAGQALATPIAVNLSNDLAGATVAGNVSAVGNINIVSDSDVQNQSEGIAGVQGADLNGTSADAMIAAEIGFLQDRANFVFGSVPVPPQTTPNTSGLSPTSGNAAAIGVNLANGAATANIAAGATVTSMSGALLVSATGDMDSNALASSNTVNNMGGIAAAIALNAQNNNLRAWISGMATANQIDVKTEMSGNGVHTFNADSTSGTGTAAIGVSGAFAATQALGTSYAFIGDGATLVLSGGGDLTVNADVNIDNVANAVPAVNLGTTVGVGASFELNSGNFLTRAEIQDAFIQGANDVFVLSTGDYDTNASSDAGAANSNAIGAAVAVMTTNNNTQANLTNSTSVSNITGNLMVSATHNATAVQTAQANSNAVDVGAGAGIALGIMQGGAQASAGNSMNVGGSVSVTANTDTFMNSDAIASHKGVPGGNPPLHLIIDQTMARALDAIGLGPDPIQINPITDVNGPSDTINKTAHGLITGDVVVYHNTGDDETIGNLVDGTAYYVRKLTNNSFRLHATFADAISGASPVNLSPTADVDVQHTVKLVIPFVIQDLITASRFGTADGAVGAAAAIALNMDFNTARASIDTGAAIQSGGLVDIRSSMDSDADAFANGSNVDTTLGVGVAAAANVSSQNNQAFVAGSVTAPSIEVRALLGGNGISDFTTSAISGGGDEANVGVAGAFAVNFSAPLPLAPLNFPTPPLPGLPFPSPIPIPTLPTLPPVPVPNGGQHAAVIQSGANLTLLNGGDLLVRSDFEANYDATADSSPQATALIGVGPSLAANAMTQRALAEIQDAIITGTQTAGINRTDIRVLANGTYRPTSNATAGASSAINLPAAMAANYNDFDTMARTLNTTNTSNITGDLMVQAAHDAISLHTADTDSGVGGTASIGSAIAVGFVEGGAQASSGMRINLPTGTLNVLANSDTFLDTNALSGQSGASAASTGTIVTEEVEARIESLLALAGLPEIPEDVIRILQRAEVETADGPVGAAAALAINLDRGVSMAHLATGGVVMVPVAPNVAATGDMDADAFADANSVNAVAGVGVAVAINVDEQHIESGIGGTVSAPSFFLETVSSGDGINHFTARATSGSGGEDVGVAGAFAMNFSGDPRDYLAPTAGGQHNALILDGANLTLTSLNDVVINSNYTGLYDAIATSIPMAGTTGVGPSVAFNAINHTARAEIGDALITGADDIRITATGNYTTNTTSEAGANNDGSLPAAIALAAASNNTIAQFRPGTLQSSIPGDLIVTANHTAVTNTRADAAIAGAQVGLGAAIAGGGPVGGGQAIAGPNLIVGGDVNALADTISTAHTHSFASQSGALITGITADQEVRRQLMRLARLAGVDDILFPTIDAHPPLRTRFDAETAVSSTADTITIDTPHEFDVGDAVVYHNNQDDTDIGGLADLSTYFISFDVANPAVIQLHGTRAHALARINPINLTALTDAEDLHSLAAEKTFDPTAAGVVDAGANTINLGNFNGLEDGDSVEYYNGGGGSVSGLTDGALYYVNVDTSNPASITAQFFQSRRDAMTAANPIDLELTDTTGTMHQVAKTIEAYDSLILNIDPTTGVNPADDTIGYGSDLLTGDEVIYRNHGDDESIGDLLNGASYWVSVVADADNHPTALRLHPSRVDALTGQNPVDLESLDNLQVLHSIEPARRVNPNVDVDTASNVVDLVDYRTLADGDAIVYRNGGGNNIGGLVDDAVYYVNRVPGLNSAIVFDPAMSAGPVDHSIKLGRTFQGFHSGDVVIYDSSGGTAVGGLTDGQEYIIRVDSDEVDNEIVYYLRLYDSFLHASLGFGHIEIDLGTATGARHILQHPTRVQLYTSRDAAIAGEEGTEVDLDASTATGTNHRFEKVFVDHIPPEGLPNLQLSAAAAIAVGASAPRSRAGIGTNGKLTVTGDVTLTSWLDFDTDSTADASSVGGSLATGIALAGNYSEAEHIAEIGADASVTANKINLLANGKNDMPFRYDATSNSTATGLGGNIAGSASANAMKNYIAARIEPGAIVHSQTGIDLLANVKRSGLTFVDAGGVDSNTQAGESVLGFAGAAGGALAAGITLDGDMSEARIGAGAMVHSASGIELRAKGNHDFDNLAVGGSLGVITAISVAAAGNYTNSAVRTVIDGATIGPTPNDVSLTAEPGDTFNSLALGSAAAGLLFLGAAVAGSASFNVIDNVIESRVTDSTVVTHGALIVKAHDDSEIVSAAGADALSISGGGLAISASVAASVTVNDVSTRVSAIIEGSPVSAATVVQVDATSTGTINALAMGGATAVAGGGGTATITIGAGITLNKIHGTTEAIIRNVDPLTQFVASNGDLTVIATDSAEINTTAIAGAFSGSISGANVSVTLAGAIGTNEVAGKVRSGIENAKVASTMGQVKVESLSTSTIHATTKASTVSASLSLLNVSFAANAAYSKNETQRMVQAYVSAGAIIQSHTAPLVHARDEVSVVADNVSVSVAGGTGIGFSIAAGISVVENLLKNTVSAYVQDSTITTPSGLITVLAESNEIVDSSAFSLAIAAGIGITAGVAGALSHTEIGGTVEAYADGATLNAVGGIIEVKAISNHTAGAHAAGGAAAMGIAFSIMHPTAKVSGMTKAYVAGNTTATATDFNVVAEGTHVASVDSFNLSIGLISGAGALSEADVSRSTTGEVAANANVQSSGNLSVTARSQNNAITSTPTTAVGAISAAFAIGEAKITENADTAVTVGQGASIAVVGSVLLDANGTDHALANAAGVSGGLLSVGFLQAKAVSDGDTLASFNGTLTSATSLTIQTHGFDTPEAHTSVVAITVQGGAGAQSEAISSSDDAASIGTTGRILSNGTAINVSATSVRNVIDESNVGAFGAFTAGFLKADAIITGSTSAFVGDEAVIGDTLHRPGSLSVLATDTSTATSDIRIDTVAIITGNKAESKATVTPIVQAFIGANAKLVLGNTPSSDVTIRATSVRAEGNATSASLAVGTAATILPFGAVTTAPAVDAHIGSGTTVNAGGAVIVEAIGKADPTGQPLDDFFQPNMDVTAADDTIFFPSHGLNDSDNVIYKNAGGASVATRDGALVSDHTYNVLRVDGDHIKLGTALVGDSVDAFAFGSNSGVDAPRDMIRFSSAHHLETGDAVVYDSRGNSSVVNGFSSPALLYVRKIDMLTIALFTTKSAAESPVKHFDVPSDVSEAFDTIHVAGGHGFSDGSRVTYRAPDPLGFKNNQVDVSVDNLLPNPITGDDGNANNIFLGHRDVVNGPILGHGLAQGQKVFYETDATVGADRIGGLSPGVPYYVIVIDAWTIQLAASPADAAASMEIAIDDGANGNSLHRIRPAAVGGLADGETYVVDLVDATRFKLETTGGAPIGLSTSNIDGAHRVVLAGLDLVTSSGDHEIRLDLDDMQPADNHTLLGPGGISLRDLSPPPNDGASAASARGGAAGLTAIGVPDTDVGVDPTVMAYSAAALIEVGGGVSILSTTITNASAVTVNGAGGIISLAVVDASLTGTSNNRAFVGNPPGAPIDGEDAAVQVEAAGMVIQAGGPLVIKSVSDLHTAASATADGGGLVDGSNALASIILTANGAAVVGANATLIAETIDVESLMSGHHSSEADALTLALVGEAVAAANLDLTSNATTLLEGDLTTLTSVNGLHGVDVRANQNNLTYDRDASPICICIGPAIPHEEGTVALNTVVDGDPGVVVSAEPRLLKGINVNAAAPETNLVKIAGKDRLALFVESQHSGVDADNEHRNINWDSDVLVFSGPTPELHVSSGGTIVKAINIGVNGIANPAPGSAIAGDISVDDIVNDDPGQIVMQSADGPITGGIIDGLRLWGTFTFRDSYQQVQIVNESSKTLTTNNHRRQQHFAANG